MLDFINCLYKDSIYYSMYSNFINDIRIGGKIEKHKLKDLQMQIDKEPLENKRKYFNKFNQDF